jgi:hypothetical protein
MNLKDWTSVGRFSLFGTLNWWVRIVLNIFIPLTDGSKKS